MTPVSSAPSGSSGPSAKTLATAAAAVALPVLYLIFVAHYSINMPYEDDWTVVPVIHAALHGRLTFGALWEQHGPNRDLFPYLILVGLGTLTHDDLRVVVMLGAVIFVASYFVFLAVFRSYQGRPLTPLAVLVLGAVWFSLEDWHNALWAFQGIAWYLIIFCLLAMVYLLQIPHQRKLALTLAVVAAIVASFSSVPGPILWPVGLVCLAWTLPHDPRLWARGKKIEILVWLGAAIGTAVLFLRGYAFKAVGCGVNGHLLFTGCGSPWSFAVRHPVTTADFLFVEVGEVIPNAHDGILWLSGVLGAVLLVVASFVVVQSVRHRYDGRNCLPVALIIFGFLFDLQYAVSRASLLTVLAPTSGYTTPALLILVGIVTYGWVHLRFDPGRTRRLSTRILLVVAAVFLVTQIAVTTDSGIVGSRAFDQRLVTGARLVVNLNEIPAQTQACYELYGVEFYLLFYPGVTSRYAGFTEARDDRLTVFSPGLFQKYRAAGLPDIPQCHH